MSRIPDVARHVGGLTRTPQKHGSYRGIAVLESGSMAQSDTVFWQNTVLNVLAAASLGGFLYFRTGQLEEALLAGFSFLAAGLLVGYIIRRARR